MTRLKVAQMNEIADGQMKMVKVEEKEILLVRSGGKVFATQNRCTHLNGNLSQGKLIGTVVTCPRHNSQFDVSNGKVLRWTSWPAALLFFAKIVRPPRSLKTYPVTVEAGNIFIDE
jgi:3-phenylpropionate/trans-cinnamate dioxygenase ferredoxin subunit